MLHFFGWCFILLVVVPMLLPSRGPKKPKPVSKYTKWFWYSMIPLIYIPLAYGVLTGAI